METTTQRTLDVDPNVARLVAVVSRLLPPPDVIVEFEGDRFPAGVIHDALLLFAIGGASAPASLPPAPAEAQDLELPPATWRGDPGLIESTIDARGNVIKRVYREVGADGQEVTHVAEYEYDGGYLTKMTRTTPAETTTFNIIRGDGRTWVRWRQTNADGRRFGHDETTWYDEQGHTIRRERAEMKE